MDNSFVIGIISWFLPGVGHLLQGRIKRGLIIGGIIWLMFIIALISGGAYYPGFGFDEGALLYLLNILPGSATVSAQLSDFCLCLPRRRMLRLGRPLNTAVDFWKLPDF